MTDSNSWDWVRDRFDGLSPQGQDDLVNSIGANGANSGGILGNITGAESQPQSAVGLSLPVTAQAGQPAGTSPVDDYVSRAELPDAPNLEAWGPRPVDPTCPNAYACTSINPETGAIETGYTPAYYDLDPVSRQSVDIHEKVHEGQLRENYKPLLSGKDNHKLSEQYAGDHPAEIETPAYQAQSDFLTNYLTNPNPNPYDAQAWQLWYDTQHELDQLKGAKR